MREQVSHFFVNEMRLKNSTNGSPMRFATISHIGRLFVEVLPSGRFSWRRLPALARCNYLHFKGPLKSFRVRTHY